MIFKFCRKDFKDEQASAQFEPDKIKAVVVSFEDGCAVNSGQILAQCLAESNMEIDFLYYEDSSPKTYLNLQQGNFFDLIDIGNDILKKTQADVVIWGYRQGMKVRLNFQRAQHYEKPTVPFFSVLNGLFLPMVYFQEENFPISMVLLIDAVILSLCKRSDNLNKVIDRLSRTNLPPELTDAELPYALNILSAVYMRAKAENLLDKDVQLLMRFLKRSYQLSQYQHDKICIGCVYAQFGELFSILAKQSEDKKFEYLQKTIESLRYCRKYFSRYNFPYDFGYYSYLLSQKHFEYWRQSNDIQALRDAVFYLRECEKIFTMVGFPLFWADIQKDLGYYLSLLGTYGKSDDILMLAVDNYRNRQKVCLKEYDPINWAKCEESVGNILYQVGKFHANEDYLAESVKSFARAADVYEEENEMQLLLQMRICQSKSEEEIMRLKGK